MLACKIMRSVILVRAVLSTGLLSCVASGAFADTDAELMQGWSLLRGWRLDSSAGRSGDPALVWQSASGTVGSSSRTVGLEPGVSYRLTAWVQAEALTNGGFAVSLEWRDPQQRYIGGKKVQEVINNDVGMIGGWRRYEAVTEPIPTDAVRSTLKVETTGKAEGRLSVCGITLEPTATKWMEFLSSSAYRDTAWEGTVRFAAPLFVNEVRHPLPTVGCELAYADGAGRAAVAKPVVFTAAEAVFELPVRNLKPGRQELVARIFDRRSDKTFESCKLAFTRTATAPKRAVWLDAKGRTLLNGKPFFPLGMYTSCKFMGEADFARWERSPFNFAMEYSHMMKPEHLDLYQKAGIYVAPDIRGLVYKRSCGGKDGPKDLETAHRLVRELVRMSASHPALIAWYMVDEAPAAWFPALAEMRNFLHETDPDHPVWAVHDHSRVARGLLPCCDVIGMDPYPIGNGGR